MDLSNIVVGVSAVVVSLPHYEHEQASLQTAGPQIVGYVFGDHLITKIKHCFFHVIVLYISYRGITIYTTINANLFLSFIILF